MLTDSKAYNGFAVDDLDAAKRFYGETLGLKTEVLDEEHGELEVVADLLDELAELVDLLVIQTARGLVE